MFIVLEKTINGWSQSDYTDDNVFDSEQEARDYIDEIGLADVAVFEFKGFA